MENTKINICLACDDNYARYAAVVIASILKNAKQNDYLCIYILDGGIEEQNDDEEQETTTRKKLKLNIYDLIQKIGLSKNAKRRAEFRNSFKNRYVVIMIISVF